MKKSLAKSHSKKQSARNKSNLSYSQRKKHHKPYRLRHIGLISLGLLIGLISVFQLGIYIGKTQSSTVPLSQSARIAPSVSTIRSSYGYSFSYDNEVVVASATELSDDEVKSVDNQELTQNKPLVSVVLKGKRGSISGFDAAAQLSIKVLDNKEILISEKSTKPSLSEQQLSADLFSVQSDANFDVSLVTQNNEKINGLETVRRVFQHTPKFGSGTAKVYSVQWSGVLDGRAFSIYLQGLAGGSETPEIFESVLESINFANNKDQSVLGASTFAGFLGFGTAEAQTLDDDYIIDSVSPAVVKIYHATCGTLVIFGEVLGGETCDLSTGSGFFVSSDGYIATNGHVVTNDAEDIFVSVLLNSPQALVSFLTNLVGLNNDQINEISQNPSILAAIIVELYNFPDDDIRLENESHTYFVALGDKPLEVNDVQGVYDLRNKPNSDKLIKANFIGADYSSKDLYVVGSGGEEGFSSSDVAIIKVPLSDTPYIRLFKNTITQNMGVSIVGFPGDADNALTDNSRLSTSVTNGSISAIRDSAGGKYKLYQSDADASRGNSGGPVLNSSGEAIGLLTYRYKNEASGDAAKSYIRAIEDLQVLAKNENISFKYDGITQSTWEKGLDLYAQNRFSSALKEFNKVDEAFKPHRLTGSYIANAKKAIDEGRDVKEFPIAISIIATVAFVGMMSGIVLAVRHRGHHEKFKLSNPIDSANKMAHAMHFTLMKHEPTVHAPQVVSGPIQDISVNQNKK